MHSEVMSLCIAGSRFFSRGGHPCSWLVGVYFYHFAPIIIYLSCFSLGLFKIKKNIVNLFNYQDKSLGFFLRKTQSMENIKLLRWKKVSLKQLIFLKDDNI
jgi:hypothetical protein